MPLLLSQISSLLNHKSGIRPSKPIVTGEIPDLLVVSEMIIESMLECTWCVGLMRASTITTDVKVSPRTVTIVVVDVLRKPRGGKGKVRFLPKSTRFIY
mmetsp:Transcript_28825/g.5212  ORF Transcript_28825/g.5212 Transcript_28825/m.5212 type:complete len:99 (-) Transcript_28825:135-431(-)